MATRLMSQNRLKAVTLEECVPFTSAFSQLRSGFFSKNALLITSDEYFEKCFMDKN